jgi:hypothetical protein
VALERIALVQLLALVWVAKFAWAPLVDRYGWRRLGHYRGWLPIVQALLAMAVLALITLDFVQGLPLVIALVGAIARRSRPPPGGQGGRSGRWAASSASRARRDGRWSPSACFRSPP